MMRSEESQLKNGLNGAPASGLCAHQNSVDNAVMMDYSEQETMMDWDEDKATAVFAL